MIKPFLLILVLLSIHVMQITGQNYTAVKNVDELKKNLKLTASTIQSIQAAFRQEKSMNILEEKVTSTGKFYYQKENKVRWEIITPEPYIVVINGSKITIKDGQKTKTYDSKSNKMFGKINQVMMASINGSFGENNDEYIETYMESSEYYVLQLQPKDKATKKYLSGIEIFFGKKDYDVKMIKMNEPGGDYTEIKFFDKVMNGTIDAKVFQLPK